MYVLLGSNGQITSQIARRLLAGGHPVRVVGRNAQSLETLRSAGAEIAAGDPGDAVFLQRAFQGATAVYTMTPPCYTEPDMRAAQDRIGSAIAQALHGAGVKRVVNLSSIGAELPQGTGPIEGLHAQEQRLDAIEGLHLLHLRPGSFMENFFAALTPIAQAGILPGMEEADAKIPMVATRDIAAVAARELVTPQHRGVRLLHSPAVITPRQAAAALGAAIGKPELPYVRSTPEQTRGALLSIGFSESACKQLLALGQWLSGPAMASASVAPAEVQPTTFEQFAREVFAPVYAAQQSGQ